MASATRARRGWASFLARLPAGLVREIGAVYARVHEVRLLGLAAEVAFFMALAAVPMVLAVFDVLSLLDNLFGIDTADQVKEVLRSAVELAFTGEAKDGVLQSLDSLIGQPRAGRLSITILTLIVLASRGFTALVRGLRVIYGTSADVSWWRERLAAIGFTLGAVLLGAFLLATFVVGPLLGTGLALAANIGVEGALLTAWAFLRWLVLGAGLVLGLAGLYHFARGGHGRWQRDLPGALLGAFGLVLALAGYRLYVTAQATIGVGTRQAPDVVGAIVGGLLATLLLMAISAAMLLIGAAFNAEHDPDVPDVLDAAPNPGTGPGTDLGPRPMAEATDEPTG